MRFKIRAWRGCFLLRPLSWTCIGSLPTFPRFPFLVLEIQPRAMNLLGKYSFSHGKAVLWICPHMVIPFLHINARGSFKKTPVSWDLAHN